MADQERHPFLQGLSKHRGTPPTVVVIFGASGRPDRPQADSGDLQSRLRRPPAGGLPSGRLWPEDDSGRRSSDRWRPGRSSSSPGANSTPRSGSRVAANTTYVSGGYDEKEGFDRLAAHIRGDRGGHRQRGPVALLHLDPPVGLRPDHPESRCERPWIEVPRQAPPLEGHHREALR